MALPFQIIEPRRVAAAAKAFAESDADGFTARLAKYVPINISLAYPVIEGVLKKRISTQQALLGISPVLVGWFVFFVLLAISVAWLHKQYQLVPEAERKQREIPHIVGRLAAFTVWTYLIGSVIWGSWYDPDVSVLAAALAAAVNGLYQPTVVKP